MKRLVLGTRGSALALAQVVLARAALAGVWADMAVEEQVFVTRGDKKLDLSLLRAGEAGGKGLFTKELEDALLAGTIDVAVHSLKDLPGHNPPGLAVTAVLERASTADVLIAKGVSDFNALPQGARIGTSSVRRARQLQWLRPDLEIEEWRGNVPTRLRKLGERDDVAPSDTFRLERCGHDRIACAVGGGRRVPSQKAQDRFDMRGGAPHTAATMVRIVSRAQLVSANVNRQAGVMLTRWAIGCIDRERPTISEPDCKRLLSAASGLKRSIAGSAPGRYSGKKIAATGETDCVA